MRLAVRLWLAMLLWLAELLRLTRLLRLTIMLWLAVLLRLAVLLWLAVVLGLRMRLLLTVRLLLAVLLWLSVVPLRLWLSVGLLGRSLLRRLPVIGYRCGAIAQCGGQAIADRQRASRRLRFGIVGLPLIRRGFGSDQVRVRIGCFRVLPMFVRRFVLRLPVVVIGIRIQNMSGTRGGPMSDGVGNHLCRRGHGLDDGAFVVQIVIGDDCCQRRFRRFGNHSRCRRNRHFKRFVRRRSAKP